MRTSIAGFRNSAAHPGRLVSKHILFVVARYYDYIQILYNRRYPMNRPRPMRDPCDGCDKAAVCATSETYKCPRFHEIFVRSWDETVAFLREEIAKCP